MSQPHREPGGRTDPPADTPPALHLTGGEMLTGEGLVRGDLAVAEGGIAPATPPGARSVDLSGCLILPGIVDLHGDGFERHLAPRRGALADPGAGLAALDAELAANGITTGVLAQFVSWEGGMRGPGFAERLAGALGEARPGLATDMRLQLRLETHLLDAFPRVEAMVAAHAVGYLVFNDHLPHGALAAGRPPPRLTGQALKAGRSPEAHLARMQALHAQGAEVPAAVAALARRLAARGVRLGSHDDATPEARAAWRAAGVRVAEFPETAETAEAAHAAGDPVILGAPNVVRGGSHAGKVRAGDVVAAGWADALASDYHYPAPLAAALSLADTGGDLAAAWRLVSETPAVLLGLSDRGVIAPGRRADLVILEPGTRRVGATLAGGRVAYMAGRVAGRFLAGA